MTVMARFSRRTWSSSDSASIRAGGSKGIPRVLVDLTGDGRADLIGFGDAGAWTALNNGDGTFQPVKFVVADLGYDQGWHVDQHPRFVADITGDGKSDLIGFGNDGVWVALGNGDGTFQAPSFVVADLGYNQGWRVDQNPRFVVDITGDGKADLVGFGNDGVWVALSNGDGSFQPPKLVLADFDPVLGWDGTKHLRIMGDLNGDGRADIIGFGDTGRLFRDQQRRRHLRLGHVHPHRHGLRRRLAHRRRSSPCRRRDRRRRGRSGRLR